MKLGTTELILILVIVILIFGPTQIPKLTRMFRKDSGKKSATSGKTQSSSAAERERRMKRAEEAQAAKDRRTVRIAQIIGIVIGAALIGWLLFSGKQKDAEEPESSLPSTIIAEADASQEAAPYAADTAPEANDAASDEKNLDK